MTEHQDPEFEVEVVLLLFYFLISAVLDNGGGYSTYMNVCL